MNSKIKNIIIFVGVAIALVLVYIFFIKKSPTADTALTSSGVPITNSVGTKASTEETAQISKDFISLLLSVKSIKLDDSILKNSAFVSLKDSSIVLMQDGNEGRLNPFAPIGDESKTVPVPVVGSADQNIVPVLDILNIDNPSAEVIKDTSTVKTNGTKKN